MPKRLRRLIAAITAAVLLCASASALAEGERVTDEQADAQAAQVQQLIYEVEDCDRRAAALNSQVNALNASVQQLQLRYASSMAKKERLAQELNDRARAMYMYDGASMMDAVFGSASFDEMLETAQIVSDIAKKDAETKKGLADAVRAVKGARAEAAAMRDQAVALKAENDAILAEKREALTKNQELYDQLMARLTEQKEQERLAAEQERARQEELERLRQEQQRQASQTQSAIDSSGLVPLDELDGSGWYYYQPADADAAYSASELGWAWPLDASARNAFVITSLMGTRESPGGVGSTDHHGTDIAADYGTPILAAEAGTVTIASVYGGYGNAVKVDHGVLADGSAYTTLYGHMSTIAASVGQHVEKGQIIGYEGSTGWSTGPHLHFEVTKDGSVVNGLAFYDQSILDRLVYYL